MNKKASPEPETQVTYSATIATSNGVFVLDTTDLHAVLQVAAMRDGVGKVYAHARVVFK